MKKWVSIVFASLLFSSCYLTRAIRYRNFYLKDVDNMASVTIPHPDKNVFRFQQDISAYPGLQTYLDTNLANTDTYAFLVIKNDTIIYEKYFGDLPSTTLFPSFSVAKSFVATLTVMAREEGYIHDLDEPITHYIPELLKNDPRFEKITIQHVLDMRSGIKNSENYGNPASDVLKLGFTDHIWPKVLHLKIEKPPGEFDYKSINTQLLAIIIERATGKKFQDYFREKIWMPLGMESDATWNIDSKKHEMVRAFCCLNATMHDFAKLGRLYLNNGNWNGEQLIPATWVETIANPDSMVMNDGYKNQWWSDYFSQGFRDSLQAVNYMKRTPHAYKKLRVYVLKSKEKIYYVYYHKKAYHAEGILGQYMYVNPEKNLVIVRTGHYWKHPKFYASQFIYQVENYLR